MVNGENFCSFSTWKNQDSYLQNGSKCPKKAECVILNLLKVVGIKQIPQRRVYIMVIYHGPINPFIKKKHIQVQGIPLLEVQNPSIPWRPPSSLRLLGQIPYWMWVMHWNSPCAGECLRNKQAHGRLGGWHWGEILLNNHGLSSKGCHVHTFSTSRIVGKKRRYQFQIPFLGGKPR